MCPPRGPSRGGDDGRSSVESASVAESATEDEDMDVEQFMGSLEKVYDLLLKSNGARMDNIRDACYSRRRSVDQK